MFVIHVFNPTGQQIKMMNMLILPYRKAPTGQLFNVENTSDVVSHLDAIGMGELIRVTERAIDPIEGQEAPANGPLQKDATTQVEPETPPADTDVKASVMELELDSSITAKLMEQGVTTVEQVQTMSTKQLVDLKGIGNATATAIHEAVELHNNPTDEETK